QMQVGDAVALDLQPLDDSCAQGAVRKHVEKDSPRTAYETPCPVGNDERADDPHEWVHPYPAELPTGQQADDGEDGDHRSCQHVDVGRAEVEIMAMIMTVVTVMMRVVCRVMLVVMMGIAQQPRAGGVSNVDIDGNNAL